MKRLFYGLLMGCLLNTSAWSAAAEAAVRAEPGEIDRLILLSPVSIARPERIKNDALFVASRDEPRQGDIKAMFEKTSAPKKLVLLGGRAHAQHIFKNDQSDKLKSTVMGFWPKAGSPTERIYLYERSS